MAEEAKPATADIVEQYDIGDEPTEATASVSTAPVEPAIPSAGASRFPPPQDPVTKKFISKEEARARGISIPGEAATEPTPAPVPQSKHSAKLLRQAKDLGLSQDEIEGTDSEQLREIVHDAQIERLQLRHDQLFEKLVNREPEPRQPQAPPEPANDDLGVPIKEEDWHPDLVKILKSIKQENAELKKRLDRAEGFLGEQHKATATEVLDRAFSELPAEFKPYVGEGGRHDFADDAGELVRRKSILDVAAQLAKSNDPRRVAKHIKAAAEKVYPTAKTVSKEEPKPISPADAAWLTEGLQKPTHRSGAAELPGKQKAMRSVSTMLTENGLAGGGTPDRLEEDELP